MSQRSGYINIAFSSSPNNIVDNESTDNAFTYLEKKKKIHKLCDKQKDDILTIKQHWQINRAKLEADKRKKNEQLVKKELKNTDDLYSYKQCSLSLLIWNKFIWYTDAIIKIMKHKQNQLQQK